MKWSIFEIWNKALEQREERELKSRNNMWATEIGGAYVDRFLKMKGTPPTNPPNARSLRKFEAGNMMEWLVGTILQRAGILQVSQNWCSFQYPGLLKVTGKSDFITGGNPDIKKAVKAIEELSLPEFFKRGTVAIVDYLFETYPEGLDEVIMEIKSCSGFMFDRYEKIGPNKNHVLQAFHYLKADNKPEAHIIYISKDDLRMLEFGVYNPSEVETEYKADIEKMTEIMRRNIQPEKEKEIIFDEQTFRFSQNWKVAYSNYLTMLYDYKSQMDFENTHKKNIASWNRTFNRCVLEKNMTDLNKKTIEEIKISFPEFDTYVSMAKEKKIIVDENDTEGGE